MTEYLELTDHLLIAEAVLGQPGVLVAGFDRIGFADSVLAAPRASFAGVAADPDFIAKPAVPCWHLVKSHRCPTATSAAHSLPRSSSWSATAAARPARPRIPMRPTA